MVTPPSLSDATEKKLRYHHGDLRAHLTETVRKLVEEKGVDGFSISEASRLAGVSSAAPYKHFSDKAEIVRAVALEGMGRLRTAMRDGADRADQAAFGKINAMGKAYIRFARDEPGVFRLVFGLTERHENDEEMKTRGQETFGLVIACVRSYRPKGSPDEDIVRRAYMLWAFVHGHAFLEIDGKSKTAEIPFDEDIFLADIARSVLM